MMNFKKLDDVTLQATETLGEKPHDWGSPQLRRIFNFRSRQVTTIYERGGLQSFNLPRGSYNNETGYAAAVTSSMQVQNFRDIEGQEEIAFMHEKLVKLGGRPPALDDLSKKSAILKSSI
jgi:hypothetical protein